MKPRQCAACEGTGLIVTAKLLTVECRTCNGKGYRTEADRTGAKSRALAEVNRHLKGKP